MNKRRLKNWLQFYTMDMYDQIHLYSSDQSNIFCRMRLCELIGKLYGIKNMAKYFDINLNPNLVNSMVYTFSTFNNFEDKIIDFSNEDVLVPEFIEYPDRFLEGYDGIIEDMRRRLL